MNLAVVRPGFIQTSSDAGVEELWPTCSLLERDGLRALVDLAHPGEDPKVLLHALGARGLAPADIAVVLLTHLHPDHIGHKALFRDALFVFHESERLAFYFRGERALQLSGNALVELTPEGLSRPRDMAGWPALDELGQRIYVRHCPGHTPGSLVYFACVDGRVHAIAGDIILDREHFERGAPPGSSWRPELIPEQMRIIAARADVIVPGHGTAFRGRRGRAQEATALREIRGTIGGGR